MKPKQKVAKSPERPRRVRLAAVLIKPVEGMSYPSILRDLKKRVNSDELATTVKGISQTCSKDLLVELRYSKEGRGQLDAAFKEAIGVNGTVRHLIPPIEVKTKDLEPSIAVKDVEDVVRRFLQQGTEMELRILLTKRPYRRNRKVYDLLEEATTLKLLKATHINIGWVSCRVLRKTEINRCYRCLGFGHMATNCRGQTVAGAAGNAVRRGIPRDPAQGNRGFLVKFTNSYSSFYQNVTSDPRFYLNVRIEIIIVNKITNCASYPTKAV